MLKEIASHCFSGFESNFPFMTSRDPPPLPCTCIMLPLVYFPINTIRLSICKAFISGTVFCALITVLILFAKRPNRLRELLLDTIKEPIIDADNDLERSKEQLHEFDEDPPDIHLVLEQCQHLQVFLFAIPLTRL